FPQVGDPIWFFGQKNASITAITPVITLSRSSGNAPLFVRATAASTTATGSSDPWGEVEFAWETNQNDSRNNYVHPVHGDTVSLDKDQKGGEAWFCFWEEGTYTVALRCRAWTGSGWVTASTSTTVTVSDFSRDTADNRFVDSANGNDANDGFDPNGFGI